MNELFEIVETHAFAERVNNSHSELWKGLLLQPELELLCNTAQKAHIYLRLACLLDDKKASPYALGVYILALSNDPAKAAAIADFCAPSGKTSWVRAYAESMI